MKSRDIDFLIYNPGVHPELLQMALSLSSDHVKYYYITSFTFGIDSKFNRLINFPLFPNKIRIIFLRRMLAIPDSSIIRFGILLDLIVNLLRRLSPGMSHKLLIWRNLYIENRILKKIDLRSVSVLITQQTSGSRLPKKAKDCGVKTVLNVSTAHYQWAENFLGRESTENPTWSKYLQGNKISNGVKTIMGAEISTADFILVGSSFVKKTFQQMGISVDKIIILNYGFDLQQLSLNLEEIEKSRLSNMRVPSDPLKVLFIGQLTQRKGISYLLNGFNSAILPRDSKLTFVGLPQLGSITNRIKSFPNTQVLGHVSRGELGKLLLGHDIFVMPSLVEGFNLSLIEALATSIPVLISTNTTDEQLIRNGETGFVVPPKDSKAISNILEYAANNPVKMYEIGLLGGHRAQNYTWDIFRAKFSLLAQELLIQ
jgi:glycosyltransferase involved in cell wall biosynthesis